VSGHTRRPQFVASSACCDDDSARRGEHALQPDGSLAAPVPPAEGVTRIQAMMQGLGGPRRWPAESQVSTAGGIGESTPKVKATASLALPTSEDAEH